MSLQQLQQEIQRMSDTPQEYENMIAAMQKMNEFAKQTNVKEMQEGGMLQTQEQEGVGAYVPPPKQTFDMTPEKKPVEMQQGGNVTNPVTLPTPTINQGTRYQDVTKPVLDTSPTIKDKEGKDINNPNFGMPVKDAQGNVVTQTVAPNIGDISAQMIEDPRLPTGAAATPVGIMTNQNQLISSGQGQVSGQVAIPTAQALTATVDPIQEQPANIQQQTATSIGGVTDVANQTQAQQLDIITQQVNAQALDKSSVSDLKAAQGSGITMNNPIQRKIQVGELIDGVANAQTASAYTEQVQAATALPSEKATVQGQ